MNMYGKVSLVKVFIIGPILIGLTWLLECWGESSYVAVIFMLVLWILGALSVFGLWATGAFEEWEDEK